MEGFAEADVVGSVVDVADVELDGFVGGGGVGGGCGVHGCGGGWGGVAGGRAGTGSVAVAHFEIELS